MQAADEPEIDNGASSAAGGRRRWRQSPLLPEAGAAGAPLTAVLAVISSLAALALAAFMLIAGAADEWTADLNASMTLQIKGVDAAEIEARTLVAVEILETTPGVVDTRVRTSRDAAKLLEPWLGAGAETFLNVPALIEIKAEPAVRENLAELKARLAAASDGLALDDHGDWNRSLSAAARAGQALAFGVFALITAAACAVAVFAARAGLAANAEIVSLLHLIGATDGFIAGQVQRRFLIIGLRGSFIGVAAALAALAVAGLAAQSGGALGYFLPEFSFSPLLLAPMLIVPAAISAATAATARLTVLNSLRKQL